MSTLHRNRSEELKYRHYLRDIKGSEGGCVFCDYTNERSSIIKEYNSFAVILNLFPYTLWDSCRVVEHYMIIPKRHIDSIAKFKEEEIVEYHSISSFYESRGYDVYSRGSSSNMKSIPHQHTHLIKTNGVKIKGLIYNEKPLLHVVY